MIRKKCNVKKLQKAVEEKELLKIDGMRKTKRQLRFN